MATRVCQTCKVSFPSKSGSHKFCSKACRRTHAQMFGCERTEAQYKLISGNWEKYFARLCTRAFRRDLLTKQDCLTLLEKQRYKCALTGVELTCLLEKGVVHKTNASIDRIDPKGPYTVENVQLVCAVLNKLRIDTPLDEFIEWCRKVADYAVQK